VDKTDKLYQVNLVTVAILAKADILDTQGIRELVVILAYLVTAGIAERVATRDTQVYLAIVASPASLVIAVILERVDTADSLVSLVTQDTAGLADIADSPAVGYRVILATLGLVGTVDLAVCLDTQVIPAPVA
jgi:hypothetical protein